MLQDLKVDLQSLWDNNYIVAASVLNTALGQEYFHANKEPMYFTGNLSAKTILVMLNPGSGNTSNRPYSFFGDKYVYKTVDEFYEGNLSGCKNYGKNDFERLDNFDTKQAAFLHDFKDLGFEIPNSFWTKDDLTKKIAKREVLMGKLQLELIPYCSVSFNGLMDNEKKATINYRHIEAHLLRVLDTLIEYERTNILFCSSQFHSLFLAANKSSLLKGKISFSELKEIKPSNLSLRFSKIQIEYKGKIIKAGIVHSFASQALPNAFATMAEYGKFCYEELKN